MPINLHSKAIRSKAKFAHILCAVFVFASSTIILLPHPHHLSHLRGSDFFTLHVGSLVLGFLAFYFSLQLLRRKQLAHRIVLLIVAGLFVSGILHGHHLWKLSIYGACLLVLAGCTKAFTVKSNNLNTGRALTASLVVLGCSILYGAIGFYMIESRAFGVDLSVWQSIKYALMQLVLFDNAIVTPLTKQGHMFVLSLDFISIASLVLVISNLFRPMRFKLFPDGRRKTAELLITRNSLSVEDFFLLWPQDKHYFFSQNKAAVIAYKVQSGVALALEGPRGDAKEFSKLLKAFVSFSEQNGWMPAFIHVDGQMRNLISALGFKALFIGSEALIDIPAFMEKTARGKHFRYVENKAKREGLTVEFWTPPLSALQIKQLRTVSDSWLSIPGRREYTFIMGYFDAEYIGNSEVAVLKNGNDTITAYTNLIPSYMANQRSIDHMRHLKTMPNIGMHYLLKRLIEHLHIQNITTFNLGLSPLSGITELTDPTITERILATLKTLGSRYYSFSGLEQFKNKFKPVWQPRYILYRGASMNLVRISSRLSKATAVPRKNDTRSRVLVGISVAAGLCYVSFLLAHPLGISTSGLASELGADGAPYNWIFNGLDIVCGVLVGTLAYAGLKQSPRAAQRQQYGLFALGGLGNIIAALAPVNGIIIFYHTSLSLEFVHSIASTISVVGFCGTALVYALTARRMRRPATVLFGGLLLLTLSSAFLFHTVYAGSLQKLQLALTAIFIALVGTTVTSTKGSS